MLGLNAKGQQLINNFLTVSNGLSSGAVECFYHDSRGFMWIGTRDGLCRFDGSDIKVYEHDETDSTSISGEWIKSIEEDTNANLWIPSNSGISIYQRKKDSFLKLNLNSVTNKGNDNLDISDLKLLNSLDLGIAIWTEDLITPLIFSISQHRIIKEKELTLIQKNYLQKNLVRLNFTIYKINPEDFSKSINLEYPNGYSNKRRFSFFSSAYNSKGELIVWDHEKDLLLKVSPDFSKTDTLKFSLPHKGNKTINSSDLILLNDSFALLGSINCGIFLINLNQLKIEQQWQHEEYNENSLINNSVNKLYRDRNGIIWLAILPYGVSILHPLQKPIVTYHHHAGDQFTVDDNFTRAIAIDKNDNVWVSFQNRMLNAISTKTHKVFYRKKCSDVNIVLTADVNGNILDGMGFKYFIGSDDNVRSSTNSTSDILKDPSWKIISTAFNGIARLTYNSVVLSNPGKIFILTNNNLIKVDQNFPAPCEGAYTDSRQHIYASLLNMGFAIYAEENNQWKKIYSDEGSYFMKSIYDDTIRKVVWIATSEGILKFNPVNFSSEWIKKKDGLPENFIYSILPDAENNLWMSSNSGIIIYNPETKTFRHFNASYGLQGNEFNTNCYGKLSDGAMVFGGPNGINVIYPECFQSDTSAPKIQITGLQINNEPYKTNVYAGELSQLNLDYDQNTISISFAALNLIHGDQTDYEVFLENYDRDWVQIGSQRNMRYAKLAPGNYQLKIRAKNEDGIYSNQPALLSINIATPYWQTWWFRTFVALIMTALIYGIYRYRLNQLLKLQEVRNKIARDLHDDIGATLSSISYTSEVAKQKLQTNSSSDALKFIEIIGDDARAMVSNMSDIVWSLSSDNNDCEKLFERMRNYASPLLSSRDINFHFNRENISDSNFIRPEIRQNLYLIFKEAINNAAKYSGAKNLYVDIKLFDHTFEMKIKDDGIGFSPLSFGEGSGVRSGGNGLTNMKIRAKSIHGNFVIKSSVGNGTEILLEKKSM